MRGKIVLCALLIRAWAVAQADGFEQAWKLAGEAKAKGSFAEAQTCLEAIEREAVAQRRWDVAVKAVDARAACEVAARGGLPGAAIPLLHAAVEQAPDPMRPLLAVMLANRYWRCFADAGMRGSSVIAVTSPSGESEEWTLPQLQAEVEHQFRRALIYARDLQAVPVTALRSVLEAGTAPDACRPTLYDFLVNEMIAFYALGEADGVAWKDGSELSENGPAFGAIPDFMEAIPDEAAKRSHVLRGLRLFQELLAFHAADKDPTAYADADFNRLLFCRRHVSGEQGEARFSAALDRFLIRWKRLEVMSRAAALRARLALDAGKPGLARLIAQNGAAAYPDSIGAAQCRNLIAEVERPRLSLRAERVWCLPWPEITVTYANLREVYFRAVPVTFEESWAAGAKPFDEAEKASDLLARKAVKEWSLPLQPAADYRSHTFRQSVPKNVTPGVYALLASSDGSFAGTDAPIFGGFFCVSRLALVVGSSGGRVNGAVVDANEGEPVAGAKVELWRRDEAGRFTQEQAALTGEDGWLTFSGCAPGEAWARAQKDGESAQVWEPVRIARAGEHGGKPEGRVAIFTDRERYRSGEAVRYKGICYAVGAREAGGKPVDGRALAVTLRDDDGQPLAEQRVESNAFGAFSGVFDLPTNGVSGRLTLDVAGMGETAFFVSDVSRGAVKVSLAPVAGEAKLGSVVALEGTVSLPDGTGTPDARVAWRAVRVAGSADGVDREVMRGYTSCDRDGRFAISFVAQPDLDAPVKAGKPCVFKVTASVNDALGQTREGSCRMTLGEAVWRSDVTCDAWQTAGRPVALTVCVSMSGGGSVEGASGSLQVLGVRLPESVRRSGCDPEGRAVPLDVSEEVFDDSRDGADGQEIASETVTTGADGMASWSVTLPAGLYRVRFNARDPAGRLVTAQRLVRVTDPESSRFVCKDADYFEAESWSLRPGETFRAVWGTGYSSGRAVIAVEQDGRELFRLASKRGVTQQTFTFPVTEAMRGGVEVRAFCVRGTRIYAHERFLDVPWASGPLTVEWDRSSALMAGKRVTWRASVRDPQGNPAVAEILARFGERTEPADLEKSAWTGACGSHGITVSPLRFSNGEVPIRAWRGAWKTASEPEAWRYASWGASFVPPVREKRAASPSGSAGAARAAEHPVLFFPHVVTGADGKADLTFTVPVGLEAWRLESFAHDKQLRCGVAGAVGSAVAR